MDLEYLARQKKITAMNYKASSCKATLLASFIGKDSRFIKNKEISKTLTVKFLKIFEIFKTLTVKFLTR